MRNEYIEMSSYEGEGYLPMIDYGQWRVAVLRYCDELLVEEILTMQKHMESDEVFVLLEGECTLFVGGNQEEITEMDSVRMKPLTLYNVKRGVWHTHTLSKEATVLIVENRDTSDLNSPTVRLTKAQRERLKELF